MIEKELLELIHLDVVDEATGEIDETFITKFLGQVVDEGTNIEQEETGNYAEQNIKILTKTNFDFTESAFIRYNNNYYDITGMKENKYVLPHIEILCTRRT